MKNAANVRGLKSIPTWKIQEILESPNCTGIDGRDYGPVEDELRSILCSRLERLSKHNQAKALKALESVKVLDEGLDSVFVEHDEFIKVNDGWFINLVKIPPMIMNF
ncbi:MAG: hypothetical protein H0X02_00780 [Nitrosomonas sp.]|nr:hypothetical protein [Nitrosomonas sp.]